ncbi:hypothetical protein NX059_005945 [Plenodomus lindquistii]|nr:hypothetical protein NX059_005945 [Plenodomus lindquistii]
MVKLGKRVWGMVVGVVAVLPELILAAQNSTAAPVAASTFWLEDTETQFSVNVANDSSDIFIYMRSPAYSWVGFGFGETMENSLMFVVYPNAKGDNLTLSPRLGSRSSEPTHTPIPTLTLLPPTTIKNSTFILAFRCSNCLVWPHGYLDTNSHSQPMIYAFGPGNKLQSDSPAANLKRHIRYGKFSMNMLAATGKGGVPVQTRAQNGVVVPDEGMVKDRDGKKLAHAVLGCVALFVLWPLHVIVAGFFKNMRLWHGCVSVVLGVCLVVAYALGIESSGEFNRSKSFTSPHQLLAFLSLLPLILSSLLPLPPISRLHPSIHTLHTPLTLLILTALILTGGLGLHLGMQPRPIILAYTAVSLLVFVFCVGLGYCIRRRGSAYARARGRRRENVEDDQEMMLNKIKMGRASVSEVVTTPVPAAYAGYGDGAQSVRGLGVSGVYGGGAMPGPKYLLNMHPGVPVQVSRM